MNAQAEAMSWDWDMEDIDTEEDDRKIWVLVTPKTLEEGNEESGDVPPEPPKWADWSLGGIETHGRTMNVYPVEKGPAGVGQACTPIRQVVQTPRIPGPIVIWANEAVSDLSEPASTGKEENKETGKTSKKSKERAQGAWIPKNTLVIMSAEPR